jgi:hypothetical protein
MVSFIRFLPLLAAPSVLSLACSGSDSGSGVSSSKKMSDLTTAEATQLCNANQAKLDTVGQGGCIAVAISTSQTAAACDTAKAVCSGQTSGISCSGANTADLAGCDLTVGELQSCVDALSGYFGSLSCSDMGKSPPPLPACTAKMQVKCSSLFGGPTGGDGGA